MIPAARLQRHQRGLAMVEMAIVLPLLLLLMLAAAELGRVLYQYNTLSKAVQGGARHLATHARLGSTQQIDFSGEEGADKKAIVRNLVVYGSGVAGSTPVLPGLSTADVEVECLGGGACTGVEHISVRASYQYQPMLGVTLPTFGLGDPIPLQFTFEASATMRAL